VFYIVTYHRLDRIGARPKAMLAEGAQALIDLLERVGVDFRLREVRGALEDILRLGSANIPDLWLSDDEMLEKGMVEGQTFESSKILRDNRPASKASGLFYRGLNEGRGAGGLERKWWRGMSGGGTFRRDSPHVGQTSESTCAAFTQLPLASQCTLTH